MECDGMTVMQRIECNECKIMNEIKIMHFDESNAIIAM